MQLNVTVHHLPFAGKFATVLCKFIMGLQIPHDATAMLMHACDRCDAGLVAADNQAKVLLATYCEHTAMAVMLAAGSQGHKLFATDCEHAYVSCNECDACCCSQENQKRFATDCEHAYVACNECDVCCCSQDERLLASHQPVPCRIGTDDATGSMRRLYSRRCRDRPGVSIPALAIPRDGSKPEPVLIYFGIIDFLQVRLLC